MSILDQIFTISNVYMCIELHCQPYYPDCSSSFGISWPVKQIIAVLTFNQHALLTLGVPTLFSIMIDVLA